MCISSYLCIFPYIHVYIYFFSCSCSCSCISPHIYLFLSHPLLAFPCNIGTEFLQELPRIFFMYHCNYRNTYSQYPETLMRLIINEQVFHVMSQLPLVLTCNLHRYMCEKRNETNRISPDTLC